MIMSKCYTVQEVADTLKSTGKARSLQERRNHEEAMMGSMMSIFHEYERFKITERMRLGKIRKVRENKGKVGLNALNRHCWTA